MKVGDKSGIPRRDWACWDKGGPCGHEIVAIHTEELGTVGGIEKSGLDNGFDMRRLQRQRSTRLGACGMAFLAVQSKRTGRERKKNDGGVVSP